MERWQSSIVNKHGDILPGVVLEVRNESNNALATVYRDAAGADPYPIGAVDADQNGYAFFYAPAGRYRISSLANDLDWRDVIIVGSLGLANLEQTVGQNDESTMSQKASTDSFAQLAGGADADFTTMPKQGGAPIVESGSNANGSWTKWADGTMIQHNNVEVLNANIGGGGSSGYLYSDIFTWTYPKTFVGSDSSVEMSVTGSARGSSAYCGLLSNPNNSSMSYALISHGSSWGSSYTVQMVAHGRWK